MLDKLEIDNLHAAKSLRFFTRVCSMQYILVFLTINPSRYSLRSCCVSFPSLVYRAIIRILRYYTNSPSTHSFLLHAVDSFT